MPVPISHVYSELRLSAWVGPPIPWQINVLLEMDGFSFSFVRYTGHPSKLKNTAFSLRFDNFRCGCTVPPSIWKSSQGTMAALLNCHSHTREFFAEILKSRALTSRIACFQFRGSTSSFVNSKESARTSHDL